MAQLIKKHEYGGGYAIRISELDLSLLIAGSELLETKEKANPKITDFPIVSQLLQDLKEIKEQ